MARVIAIANQKGGVGKTTTTINLSAAIAELGRRVLLIDLDPQANATSGVGLPRQEGNSLYPLLLEPGPVDGLIQETPIENVWVIPSELDLAGCEVEIARQEHYLHCLSRLLDPLIEEKRFDYIMLDCPPSLGILTMNALAAAQDVVVPMQCEYYALEGLSVIASLIERLRKGANPRLSLEGIVMTMYDGRTNLASDVVNEVRSHFEGVVYETVIPRNIRLSEAPSHGEPITRYDSYSPGARAYRFLAREFLKRQRKEAETRDVAERQGVEVAEPPTDNREAAMAETPTLALDGDAASPPVE